ncbi:hypothetical protein WA026_017361 [Henosepilachna vigintioctopunctata]|uniref:Uncharacterized protein n=1 Tax=Henosepilachna vigintioctopunctata TaxID=420089 RepID=A0AAW1VHJ9_9CUCU
MDYHSLDCLIVTYVVLVWKIKVQENHLFHVVRSRIEELIHTDIADFLVVKLIKHKAKAEANVKDSEKTH